LLEKAAAQKGGGLFCAISQLHYVLDRMILYFPTLVHLHAVKDLVLVMDLQMTQEMRKCFCIRAGAAALIAAAIWAHASTIATNPPAEPLTRERIALLPPKERSAWIEYLEASTRQRQADKDFVRAELKRLGIEKPVEPPHGNSARSIPLDREAHWYASPDAQHIADVIVSFQTPAGGWGKNLDMSKKLRRPSEAFTANNLSKFLSPGDFDSPMEPEWNYFGTVDNDATTTQMKFLAKVIHTTGIGNGSTYRKAFLRGMDYLFAAQFPNGGWPQVWPLEGGYHDAITYNDDAIAQVVDLMGHAADGKEEFSFVPQDVRDRAARSFERGIECILASQIVVNGMPTVWPQQNDALTLKPVSGRNYEMPAEATSESASLMLLLMDDLPHPAAAEQRSIRAAAAWFKKTAIYNQRYERGPDGSRLVATPGAGPIWARYYQIGTEIPIFGDRDKSIHDRVNEISRERQNGYSWYSSESQRALDRFEKWNVEHPE
jgi:PelA/Pel-15E family pectate lyase